MVKKNTANSVISMERADKINRTVSGFVNVIVDTDIDPIDQLYALELVRNSIWRQITLERERLERIENASNN